VRNDGIQAIHLMTGLGKEKEKVQPLYLEEM
jgi:hypothetical protein